MSRYALPILLSGLLYTAMAMATAPCENPDAAITLSGKTCDASLKPPQVSCLIPTDVQGALAQGNQNTVQRAANLFSWQQFIALNWPASTRERGQPDAQKPVTASGARVWESWKEAYEVYLADGAEPNPWNQPQPVPAACGDHKGKWLMRDAKVGDIVDATLQALPADATLDASLKDQQGRLVRYEIRLSPPLFDYILKHQLYNGKVQAQATAIDFPDGSQLVKAAWREIDADDADYFLTTDACVCDESPAGPTDCDVRRMGLAGLHLMTKTASAPQWIWSTFEQVDNTLQLHPQVTPLNDPDCPPEQCPPNQQTAAGIPTQLSRVIPIPDQDPVCEKPERAVDNLVVLNRDIQQSPLLDGSFLRHYELVGTQWPLPNPHHSVATAFRVRPELLGNTTMESFSQNTSSCMGCHVMSRTLNPDRYVSGDFSFTLNNAEPRPAGSRCVNVEASESCSDRIIGPLHQAPRDAWEREHWDALQLGVAVTTRTYEVLGRKHVGSRLHCESCHLNGGGNPDAAWWVDMERHYARGGTTLPERINGCFERSMNGRALCDTANGSTECDSNPAMQGLLTYMQWLTREYRSAHPHGTPARGYPRQVQGIGEPARGHEIYTQKCAFCHNNAGQGRYASHTYFRPALWGPDSYNACAGMADVGVLASFLQANMPYTSGGMLTDQEAIDLATYIDSQCRPGKGGIGPNGELCSLSPSCANGKQVAQPK